MYDLGGLAPARHILGNYELFEEVGRGGMGIVYRALDLSLDRVVAVKILRDDLRSQPQIVTRFSREAKAAACLDHPNIVQIYAVGNVDGTPYIAMEFVDAVPLSTIMQRESCLPYDLALHIAEQVASALDCAHESHVIHRDIKPPNILIADDGKAYVTDFGIAKILTMDDNLTVDGSRLGTPHYMSPERCKNGELTGSSDLYSLGVLLFQMLTGRLPYEAGSNIELIRRIVSDPPTRLRRYRADVPEDVERLVAWMIEKQPHHRPANCGALCEAIDRVRHGKPLDSCANTVSAALADFRTTVENRREPLTPIEHRRRLSWATPFTTSDGKCRGTWVAGGLVAIAIAAGTVAAAFRTASPTETVDALWSPQANDPQRWYQDPTVARFDDESPGVVLAPVRLAEYAVVSFADGSTSSSFAVLFRGERNTHHKGRWVVCEVDPVQRIASIAVAPGLPLHNPTGLPQTTMPPVYPSEPDDLRHAVQKSNAGAIVTLAVHPDGARFAVASVNAEGATELTEWSRMPDGGVEPVRHLAQAGLPVANLQYDPTGQWLAYTRHHGENDDTLWLVSEHRLTPPVEPLARGNVSLGNRAFSPDGLFLAYAMESRDGVFNLRLVRTGDRKLAMELGEGACASWLPSDQSLVATATDRKGVQQLWAVSTEAPYSRRQLTHLDGGTGGACALSEEGSWVVATVASAELPTLVFAQTAGVARQDRLRMER